MQTILGANGQIAEELARELRRNYTTDIRLVSRNSSKINEMDELLPTDLLDARATDEAVEGSEIAYLTVGLPMVFAGVKIYHSSLIWRRDKNFIEPNKTLLYGITRQIMTASKTMTKLFCLTAILLFFVADQTFAQSKNDLQQKIRQIVSTKKAVVGVSISGNNGDDKISVNGEKHFPMQSVFKFHIGLLMLSEIDEGKFSLDQKVEIQKKDLLPDLYSPIRDKYPDGATLAISEILKYTISNSDNVGCEVLLRLLGGPQKVEDFFVKNKFKDVATKYNEEQQQADWNLQFHNWTTPNAANKVLKSFYDNRKKLLSQGSYDFIWKAMRETETGKARLKGRLPENTVVAHKTGTSGVNKTTGVTAAVNDIGVIFLPDGRHFFISVFVTDSKEDTAANEKIIADIAKAAWDYFITKKN